MYTKGSTNNLHPEPSSSFLTSKNKFLKWKYGLGAAALLFWLVLVILNLPIYYLIVPFIIIIPIFIIKAIIDSKGTTNPAIVDWLQGQGFSYFPEGNKTRINERWLANPNKDFFRGETFGMVKDYAVGRYNGRQAYIYKIQGIAVETAMYIWCIEFVTNKIPLSITVTKRYLKEFDSIQTESNDFEALYDVNASDKTAVLQLLDPVMMQLIVHSRIAAFEFSDSSVVFYCSDHKALMDSLKNVLASGIKIAEQVDRNFPLGKYEIK